MKDGERGEDGDRPPRRGPGAATPDAPEPLLRPQAITAPAPKRRPKPAPPICQKCWRPIRPLPEAGNLVGGFGHRSDCPDAGIQPGNPALFGRWLYAEPGWDTPVFLCEVCGQAARIGVGDDENYVVLPAREVEDWEWVQWINAHPETRCRDCGQELPAANRERSRHP